MLTQSRIRLSQVVGQPVTGPQDTPLGRVSDVVVHLQDTDTPTISGILLRLQGGDMFVPRRDIAAIDATGVRLASTVTPQPFERRPGEVLLVRDVRGRAVIDMERGRLVRVSDLVLEQQQEQWYVVAVVAAPPTSMRSLLNRLLNRTDDSGEEIAWRNVEPLVGHVPTAGRRIAFPRLARLKPAEIADLVEQASHHEGQQILDAVSADEELEADVFEELDEGHRSEFLKERTDAQAAELLDKMEPDHAADLLMELPQERRRPILELLGPEQQPKVRRLLGYHPETAGGLMNNEFVTLQGDYTVASALEQLRAMDEVPAVLTDVYVVSNEHLAGALTLSQLLRAAPGVPLRDIMQTDPEAVFADADLPSIAVHMADYNLASLPVIDAAGRLVGIVTYDDLIEAMLPDEWRWRGRPATARIPDAGSAPGEPQQSAPAAG